MRVGFTLTQILAVITILALVSVFAAPRYVRYRDRLNVRSATLDIVSALSRARSVAFERSTRAAVTFDAPTATLAVHSYADTLEVRPLRSLYGVSLAVTRDSVTYAANAMGFGASNSRIIVLRGSVAETLTVSRLGRVKR